MIGWSIDRFGPKKTLGLMGIFAGLSLLITSQINSLWQIYLSYSVLLAMGTGGIVISVTAAVSKWFDQNRGLAIGIATSGTGLGTLVIAPFAGYLITEYGWRQSFLILGLIAIVVIISLAVALRENPEKTRNVPISSELSNDEKTQISSKLVPAMQGVSLSQALKTRSFWIIQIIWILYSLSIVLILTHIVPHTTDMDIPVVKASVVLSIMGGFAVISRLITGRISDVVGRKKPAIGYALLGAGALILLIWSDNLWLFYLFAAVYGMYWGGIGVALLALSPDIFGQRCIGTIMGVLETGYSIGAAIGSVTGGIIFDTTGSYSMAFVIASVCILLTIPLVTMTRCEMGRETL